MQFKSIHAIRIYELLKQYQDIGERTLTIDEIKECCGVKDKFKQYIEFEKYLLFVTISLQWHAKSFARGLQKVLTSPFNQNGRWFSKVSVFFGWGVAGVYY